jgi:hypothetical protein
VKFVLAPDLFKESMGDARAVTAMRAGIQSVLPTVECVGVPMVDGGECTVDAVVDALNGRRVTVEVTDALGLPGARFGATRDGARRRPPQDGCRHQATGEAQHEYRRGFRRLTTDPHAAAVMAADEERDQSFFAS